MKLTKKMIGIFSALVISSLAVFPAAAAQAIESVELEITSSIKAGDSSSNVNVKSLSKSCTVSETSVTNKPSDAWEEGDNPKLKVILKADGDDYKFTTSFSKSDVKVKGNDATVTKVSRSGNTKMTVYITLEDVKKSGGAVNNKQENNKQNNNQNSKQDDKKEEKQPDNSKINIKEEKPADSVKNTDDKPQDKVIDQVKIKVEETKKQGWEQDSKGWRWCGQDGANVKNQWQKIDDKWYYFDDNGYMATGWKQVDGKWYYMDENGAMLHDTTTPDGYRVGSDGAMIE